MKDAIGRDIIAQLDQAGVGIASGTYEIVGLPKLQVDLNDVIRHAEPLQG